MRPSRPRLLASAAAIVTLAGAVAAVAIPSAAAAIAPAVALASSVAPAVPAGSVPLGAVPAGTKIHVDVGLNLGNQAGLTALLNGLADKKSPYYRDFLGKGQFGPLFGLSLAQIGQVSAALRSLGLDPGAVDSGRLLIPVTATAGQLEHAFGVSLVDYRLPGGRVAYANTAAPKVPAAVAPYVEGIIGLDDLAAPQHMSEQVTAPVKPAPAKTSPVKPAVPAGLRDLAASPSTPAAKGPQPCTAATDTAVDDGGFTSDQYAEHYGLSSLYAMGDLGQGVHVAVAELEPNLATDISAFELCYGITTPVSYITVDPGTGTGAGSGEAALDIENIASLAPDVVIDDYQSPSTMATSLLDIADAVASKKQDQVLSISWGLCEANAGDALLTAFGKEWEQLDAEGITVVSAAGDAGSTGCYEAGSATSSDALAVDSPASTPFGLSVGGSTMTSASESSPETTWNGTGTANPGAGGGGVSDFCMPEYQDYKQVVKSADVLLGMISQYSQTNASCVDSSDPKGYLRQVPDLSANAGAPYVVYYDGAWTAFIGTSASTTLVAASAALLDSSPYCSSKGYGTGAVGLLPQALYGVMSSDGNSNYIYDLHQGIFQDVTTGNNDDGASGYTGGLYPATAGYDMATGLGLPLMSGLFGAPAFTQSLTSDMCDWFAPASFSKISTNSVSPMYGKAGKAITVTVKGSAFLAIPGADAAKINTDNNLKAVTELYANCVSHTECKLTLPALKAGTYDIEMLVVNTLPCAKGCKIYAKFIVAGPPKITKISPASGAQGTRVTIRGSNFFGVSAVYFGGRKGTGLKVISATEVTVVAPKGFGAQKVKVIAAGGTSNEVTFTY